MIYWRRESAEDTRLSALYLNMMFFLLGAYGWEYLLTFGVEYAIIRRRLPFRWPLVPYLAGRLALLSCLLLLVTEMSQVSFNCQPGTIMIAIFGGISIGSSSANLMIRTWVIWKDSRLVHILVLLATLGHWALLIADTVNIEAYKLNGACVVYLDNPEMSAAVFMYTVCYDFLVLILSIVKLSKQPSKSPLNERLRAQGLLYFAIAAVTYIPPAVLVFRDSTAIVGIFGTTAMTASTIGSCRAVRSLLELRTSHSSDARNEREVVLTTQVVEPSSPTLTGIC